MAEKKWVKIEAGETWNFEENPEFIGAFVSMQTEVGPKKQNVYSFQDDKGKAWDIWGSAILDARFKTLVPGQEVKVVYKGEATSEKTGREYHNFEVYKAE